MFRKKEISGMARMRIVMMLNNTIGLLNDVGKTELFTYGQKLLGNPRMRKNTDKKVE